MRLRASRMTILLAVMVAARTAAVSAWSVAHTVAQLFDPCVRWDDSGSSEGIGTSIGAHDKCRSVTVIGESKPRTITKMILIPGIVFASTLLAAIAVLAQRRPLILVGSILLLCETPFVFSLAPLTLVTGLLDLVFAIKAPADKRSYSKSSADYTD